MLCSQVAMEDQLLGMALPHNVPCTGWRPSQVDDWRAAIGMHDVFELDGGTGVTAEHYFQASVRHMLPDPTVSFASPPVERSLDPRLPVSRCCDAPAR